MIDFRLTETDKTLLERTRAEAIIVRRYAREFDENESEMIPDSLPEADDFYANLPWVRALSDFARALRRSRAIFRRARIGNRPSSRASLPGRWAFLRALGRT